MLQKDCFAKPRSKSGRENWRNLRNQGLVNGNSTHIDVEVAFHCLHSIFNIWRTFFFAHIINCNLIASCSQKIKAIGESYLLQRYPSECREYETSLMTDLYTVDLRCFRVSIICGFHKLGIRSPLNCLLTWFHEKYLNGDNLFDDFLIYCQK